MWGRLGVRLFFVISGYLITRILLEGRAAAENEGTGKMRLAGRFYVRRFLRLTPAYYITLLTMAALHPGVASSLGWHLAYLSNFKLATPDHHVEAIAHFWSLAVEEQFYLLWPLLVLSLKPRQLLAATAVLFLAAPLYRGYAAIHGWNHEMTQWQLPACADSLAAGGFLAIISTQETWRLHASRLTACSFAVGLPLLVFCYSRAPTNIYLTTFGDTGCALVFTWLVYRASKGISNWTGRLLDNRMAVYLGKISYGIYVYHYVMPYLWNDVIAAKMGWAKIPATSSLSSAAIFISASIAVAVLSWQLIEVRILSLKKHFR